MEFFLKRPIHGKMRVPTEAHRPSSSNLLLWLLKSPSHHLSVSSTRLLKMADQILDYTIGPVGRSVLIATSSNATNRGHPDVNHVYPFTDDSESLLCEVPEHDIFTNDFVVYLSGNSDMDETYERFDRGTLQFLRPEHVAFPAEPPMKKTTETHIKTGEYFANEDSENAQNQIRVTITKGGDPSQYAHHSHEHMKGKSPEQDYRMSTFTLGSPKGYRKAIIFNFGLDPGSPPPQPRLDPVPRCPSSGAAPKSDQWFDSVRILVNQEKQGGKILTINFRIVEKSNDSGAEVVPVLYDVAKVIVKHGHVTVVTTKLKRVGIPKPSGLV